MNFNLHTHTTFCDGKAEPEDYIQKAIALGFHTLGFSGHAPVPFENNFSIKDDALEHYFDEITRLKEKYKSQICILLSLEIDFIPGITKDFSIYRDMGNLNYIIGGIHLVKNTGNNRRFWFIDGPFQEKYDQGLQDVFHGNPRKGVEAYYNQLLEMITTQKPDIIAHLDKIKMHNKNRFFSEQEKWYQSLVWKVLKYIATETNSIVEINTRGLYKKRSESFFPGPEILEQIHHLNIPVTLSSDAHMPEELDGYYSEAFAMMKDIGFKELILFDEKGKRTQRVV